ncbi:MAG: HAMP domain-containing histidine kinase [Hyphomicrobiales bacterium]|nr:HAMP domain-containing histidine kinase [Hyphomicrobiales bacterium]
MTEKLDESRDEETAVAAAADSVPLTRGLSTKLLLLTILFVLIAEVLIFMPSIANFRLTWMQQKLGTAAAVGVALVQGKPDMLSRSAQDELLMALGARAIAVRDAGESHVLVVSRMPPHVDEQIDVNHTGAWAAIAGAIDTALFGGDRMLRIHGKVGESDMGFEIIIPDEGLRRAMMVYARNIALLSLLISLITAGLVFYAINRIMIRPIRDMTRSMLDFARAPDDPGRIIRPELRGDEIGVAERELSSMQEKLRKTLAGQKHLADLGLAVSKINHDMRNVLASAQLISDRLSKVRDPSVQASVPKLVRSLNRAVAYTEGVLAYGRTQEAPPSRRLIRLRQLVEEVRDMLGIEPGSEIGFENDVDAGFEIDADPEQLFRVLANLSRNAIQAMAGDAGAEVVKRLSVSAMRTGSVSRVTVADTGPGLPARARENLFAAFRGAARSGGTGLGLAIARELVRAHGGSIELVESVGGRTVFAFTIPDQPVRIEEARSALRRPA